MKAKNGKSLSAQCASACVGADVPRRVRERDEGWDERTERERREARRAKGRGRVLKKSGFDGETREEGTENPQVFDL